MLSTFRQSIMEDKIVKPSFLQDLYGGYHHQNVVSSPQEIYNKEDSYYSTKDHIKGIVSYSHSVYTSDTFVSFFYLVILE